MLPDYHSASTLPPRSLVASGPFKPSCGLGDGWPIRPLLVPKQFENVGTFLSTVAKNAKTRHPQYEPEANNTERVGHPPMRSTVTLHVVSSLDGFIAKKDNSISWMDSSDVYERGVTDDGAEVLQSIDCYVLGSRTYEHALQLGWPYGDTPTVVITNRELPSTRKSVEFYSGDLKRLVGEILAPRYAKHLAGGRGHVRPEFSQARLGG